MSSEKFRKYDGGDIEQIINIVDFTLAPSKKYEDDPNFKDSMEESLRSIENVGDLHVCEPMDVTARDACESEITASQQTSNSPLPDSGFISLDNGTKAPKP